MSFVTPYDVANRCLQHLGQPRITTFADLSMQATETGFIYDKVRRAELRRAVWTSATRRAVLRARTATTQRVVFAAYAAATTYAAGDVVSDSTGYLWLATTSGTGIAPGTTGYYPMWVSYTGPVVADSYSATANYIPGDLLVNSGVVYICVAASVNHIPPNASFFHVVQGATLAAFVALSPAGYNPAGTIVRSAFPLPANFMRFAAQDPKQPANAVLSVSAGMKWADWEIEGGALYSATLVSPAVIRFVGDTQDVTSFDDMFCEGIAARMGMNLCERFTGSKDKMADLQEIYNSASATARAMSSIEAGSTEDDFQAPPPAPAQR